MRRMSSAQIYHGHNGVTSNWLRRCGLVSIRRVRPHIHSKRLRPSQTWMMGAIMRQTVIHRSNRQRRVRSLLERPSSQPTQEFRTLSSELQRSRRGRQVQLARVVVLVLALHQEPNATQSARVSEYIDFLDAPRRCRRRHFPQLLASVHYELRLVELLHTHVVGEGRLGSRVACLSIIRLMNSIPS